MTWAAIWIKRQHGSAALAGEPFWVDGTLQRYYNVAITEKGDLALLKNIKISYCVIALLASAFLAFGLYHVHSFSGVTEGGVLGAVHEVCTASGCGAVVEEENVPLLSLTHDLCREFGVDPLRLISSGSMLIATPRPEQVLSALSEEGIGAAVIGKAVAAEEGFTIHCTDGVSRVFGPPRPDEIYKLFE